MPEGVPRVRVVHLPRTIDNDYKGIDFTFGFFTAVDFMAKEVLNMRADAERQALGYCRDHGPKGGLATVRRGHRRRRQPDRATEDVKR